MEVKEGMINLIEDVPLIDNVFDYDVILVGTNCYQVMRNGFQYDIAKKFPHVKAMNNNTKYGDPSKTGTILECNGTPSVTLMYITFGYNFKGNDKEYLDYNALEQCLKLCGILYNGKKVATTMLGCTFYDGNGQKDKVLDIMGRTMKNVSLDVYDYKQESYCEIKRKEFEELKKRH